MRYGATPRLDDYVATLGLIFLGSIAVLPFLQPYRLLPLTSFYSEWLAIGLGIGACLIFLTLRFWENLTAPCTALHLSWLVGWIAVQSFFVNHIYITQALLPSLYLVWAMLLIVVAGRLRHQLGSEKVLGALAWFLLVGGTLQAFAGLAQYLGLYGWLAGWVNFSPHNTIVGNIAQKNHLAAHVTLAALALVYLYVHRHVSRGLTYPLLMLLAVILTLTGSRSVWLYVAIASALSLVAYRKTRNPIHHGLAAYSALLLVFFVAAQLFMPAVNEWLNMLLGTDRGEIPTTLQRGFLDSPRLVEWHKAWLIFLQSPIVGVGMGHYGWHSFNLHALPEFANTSSSVLSHHAHNLFLEVAAELGIVGLILLVVLLARWLRQFSRNWLVPANWLVASVLLVLFIHSNLEYPLWYSYFLGIAAIFMGISDDRAVRIVFTPRLGQIATASAFALIFAILVVTYAGFRDLANVNMLILEMGPEQAAARITAISKNPLLTPTAEAILATHGRPGEGEITRQLAITTRVMHHHPNPIKVQRQIVYLALAGHMEESVSLMRQAAIAYARPFANFTCALRETTDERIRPLVTEADSILASAWYTRIVPEPHKLCIPSPS